MEKKTEKLSENKIISLIWIKIISILTTIAPIIWLFKNFKYAVGDEEYYIFFLLPMLMNMMLIVSRTMVLEYKIDNIKEKDTI